MKQPWYKGRILGLIVSVVIGLLLAVGMMGVMDASTKKQQAWYHACLEDRKQYECDAMWDASQGTYMWMPIFIPSGR